MFPRDFKCARHMAELWALDTIASHKAHHGETRGRVMTIRSRSHGREEKGEHGPASWDRGSSYAHDRGRPTDLHQIEWPNFSNFEIRISL